MTLPLLIPLDWPIQQPSPIAYLVLLLFLPLTVGGVITLIGLAPSWRRGLERSQSSTEIERKDS